MKEKKKQEKLENTLKYKENAKLNKERRSMFKKTKSLGGLKIDEITKQFKLETADYFKVFEFSELESYELIENGSQVVQGGISLGRAAIGGVLLGGVGALVGALTGSKNVDETCTEMKIKVVVTGLNEGEYFINIINKPVKKGSLSYKLNVQIAESIINLFENISNE